ncbi:hypothetical protein [Carnobacterium funditum]|uniref:hypothetical protein n=1 Tax=Carnobacterium funditum TaxID=2752 RepID=UPI0005541AF4|nr:hypothetical protein [Carnobacterium funditum]
MASKMSSTLLTVPWNRDSCGNGRETYTMLHGPSYYSFNYEKNHFVFLDLSPGWAGKKAISDEQ